jgi:hypothetical protein
MGLWICLISFLAESEEDFSKVDKIVLVPYIIYETGFVNVNKQVTP